MRRHILPATLLAVLAIGVPTLFAGCTPPGGVTDLDVVRGFRVSGTFNAFTQPCEIRYTLAEPAYVEIRITQTQPDGSLALVRQITPERRETSGSRSAAWRGVGPNGLFAPQGTYNVELYARLDGSDHGEAWTLTTIMFRA